MEQKSSGAPDIQEQGHESPNPVESYNFAGSLERLDF